MVFIPKRSPQGGGTDRKVKAADKTQVAGLGVGKTTRMRQPDINIDTSLAQQKIIQGGKAVATGVRIQNRVDSQEANAHSTRFEGKADQQLRDSQNELDLRIKEDVTKHNDKIDNHANSAISSYRGSPAGLQLFTANILSRAQIHKDHASRISVELGHAHTNELLNNLQANLGVEHKNAFDGARGPGDVSFIADVQIGRIEEEMTSGGGGLGYDGQLGPNQQTTARQNLKADVLTRGADQLFLTENVDAVEDFADSRTWDSVRHTLAYEEVRKRIKAARQSIGVKVKTPGGGFKIMPKSEAVRLGAAVQGDQVTESTASKLAAQLEGSLNKIKASSTEIKRQIGLLPEGLDVESRKEAEAEIRERVRKDMGMGVTAEVMGVEAGAVAGAEGDVKVKTEKELRKDKFQQEEEQRAKDAVSDLRLERELEKAIRGDDPDAIISEKDRSKIEDIVAQRISKRDSFRSEQKLAEAKEKPKRKTLEKVEKLKSQAAQILADKITAREIRIEKLKLVGGKELEVKQQENRLALEKLKQTGRQALVDTKGKTDVEIANIKKETLADIYNKALMKAKGKKAGEQVGGRQLTAAETKIGWQMAQKAITGFGEDTKREATPRQSDNIVEATSRAAEMVARGDENNMASAMMSVLGKMNLELGADGEPKIDRRGLGNFLDDLQQISNLGAEGLLNAKGEFDKTAKRMKFDVGKGTGPGQSWYSAIIAVLGSTSKGIPDAVLTRNKQALLMFANDMLVVLSKNPKIPIHEQKNLSAKLLPEPGFFKDAETMKTKITGLKRELNTVVATHRIVVLSPSVSDKVREKSLEMLIKLAPVIARANLFDLTPGSSDIAKGKTVKGERVTFNDKTTLDYMEVAPIKELKAFDAGFRDQPEQFRIWAKDNPISARILFNRLPRAEKNKEE
jgi:hypothetical protein